MTDGSGGLRPPAPQPNQVAEDYVLKCLVLESEGDGMLFAALMRDKLLYVAAEKSWYIWSGQAWRRDELDCVPGFVRYVTDCYGAAIERLEEQIPKPEAGEAQGQRGKSWAAVKIEQLQNKIRFLRRDAGRTACIKFARQNVEGGLVVPAGQFDQNPWLLGVQNGVVNLKSGELWRSDSGDRISKQCACIYDPNVDQRPWRQFIDDITCGDQELARFLQCLVGQALVGEVQERVFPFLLGRRGANGKSQFLNALRETLGEYAGIITNRLFIQTKAPKGSGQADADLMALEGLRLAICSEVPEYARFDAEQIKRLTGNDRLSGRNPYETRSREFKPSHTCLMVGNNEPVPPTGDQAFWDRTFLIHFNARFVKANPDPAKGERLADPKMESKLMGMMPQILAWAVEGCMQWQADGCRLKPPESVLKSTQEYRKEEDWISQFVAECCEESPGNRLYAQDLYKVYCKWQEERNSKPIANNSFGRKMKNSGYEPQTDGNRGKYYLDLAVTPAWDNQGQDGFGN